MATGRPRQIKDDPFAVADLLQPGATAERERRDQQPDFSALGLPDLLGSSLGASLGTGLNSILDIINRKGASDPAWLNRTRAANFRNAAAQRQAFDGRAAQRGMQRSGVAAAIGEALEGAGLDRDAAILAKDAERAQKREFDAAKLLLSMIAAESRNQAFLGESAKNRKVAKKAALDQFLANLLGGGAASGAMDILDRLVGSKQREDDDDDDTEGTGDPGAWV